MSRGPCTFKQSDITKAVKAVVAAGVQVERVEVDKDGKISVVTAKPTESATASGNELDRWMAKHADPAQGH
jgi:ATP-dependent exoDNAse (exonuclease V) alpha subunit